MAFTILSAEFFTLFIFGILMKWCNAENCNGFFSTHCENGCCSYGCCRKNLPVPALVGAIVGPIFVVFFIVVVVCACCHYRRMHRMMGSINYVEQRTFFTPGVGRTHMTYIAAGGPSPAGVTGYPTQPQGAALPQYPAHPVAHYPPAQYPPNPPTECSPPQYPPSKCRPTQYPPSECPPYDGQN